MNAADQDWERLAALIADVIGHDAAGLRPDSVLAELPGWDSYANLQLIGAVEEDFSVVVTTDDIVRLRTTGDLLRYVQQHRGKGA